MSPAAITFDGSFAFSPRPNRAHEIPWRAWSPDAFQAAREDQRPVLLSLGATWSSGARQMDEGAYSDQRVIELATSAFMPVRVDVDERPDVFARYGLGNVPVTAFLTPDGDPISSAAVLDTKEFIAEAERVLSEWQSRRDDVLQRADASRATRAAERATTWAARPSGGLTPAILDLALDLSYAQWPDEDDSVSLLPDRLDSNLNSDVIRLWRYAYHRREMAPVFNRAFDFARSLTESGLHDRQAGGFFHAASSASPVVTGTLPPKFAAEQGAMLVALAELASSDDEVHDELAEPIEEAAAYLMAVLGEPSGAVSSSQLRESSRAISDDGQDYLTEHEGVDRRVFAGSAAEAARGLLVAGTLLDRSDWVERGRRIVDFLLTNLRAGEAGMYHAWDEGGPRTFGILADQAQSLLALLTCYEVTGQPLYFDHARRIARVIERDWHEPGMGFLDVAAGHDETGLLAEPAFPIEENVDTAEAFLWLGRLTHDERYLQVAQETLSMFAQGIEGRSSEVFAYARVVDRLLSAEPEFKIVAEFPAGEPDSVADPLHRAALRLPLAGRTVQRLDREGDSGLMRQLNLPDVAKVAYVCMGSICSPPITDPEQYLPSIEQLLEQPAW